MSWLVISLAVFILLSLALYVVFGGADFGGGILTLMARGSHRESQRALIREAIAPIWEANHVWLILIIVLLFTGFPTAFAYTSTVLHVPLTLMLVGIVIRGSAFAFRQYDPLKERLARWERLFAFSSLLSPFSLGVCLAAITEGNLPPPSATLAISDFFLPWLTTFCALVGMFTVLLFAYLAAVYLTTEAKSEELQHAFRRMALGILCFLVPVGGLILGLGGFPFFRSFPGLALLAFATLATGATVHRIYRRDYRNARYLAGLTAILIVFGWGFSHFPFLIYPHLSLAQTAAPPETLRWLLGSLSFGTLILLPSLYFLYRLFKG